MIQFNDFIEYIQQQSEGAADNDSQSGSNTDYSVEFETSTGEKGSVKVWSVFSDIGFMDCFAFSAYR